jgi:hypothetical protein
MSKKKAEADHAQDPELPGDRVDMTGASAGAPVSEPVLDPHPPNGGEVTIIDPPLTPATTGAANSTTEDLAKRLRTLAEEAGCTITLHGWTMRVIAADGSSQLVEPLPSGDLQIVETRDDKNHIKPSKGPEVIRLSAFVDSLKSTKEKHDTEERHQRTA